MTHRLKAFYVKSAHAGGCAVAAAGQEDDGEPLLCLVRHGATEEVLATLEDALYEDLAPLARTRAAMAPGAPGHMRSLPALESALDDAHPTVHVQGALNRPGFSGGFKLTLAMVTRGESLALGGSRV